MNLLRRLFVTTAFFALSGAAFAAPVVPAQGVHYQVLPQQVNPMAGKQVEVIEFFAYYCPHCNVFEPLLAEWVKKQGSNIVFKRVHVAGGPRVLPQQKLFYTLEALGLLEQYHARAFAAIHEQDQRFANDKEVLDWAAKAGIDRARFASAYNSFGVQAQVRRAGTMMNEYRVDHWPMVVIDGRFVTSPSMANPEGSSARTETEQQQVALQVMDTLVAKAKADKK
ncbi:thiol:disulfide interchange protein DsbA/DsbL [Massilia sp. Dwa41.01b]|uniref:thiol:disulfide interchange protein DsbA/DsbL n=1 Tax=unclassified Massilia TaxID=2609279 RepID=UPI0016002BE0|nr:MULTISPECIES: thiol:disulfide interchange protein DsbA/DsbL [unclassified Massilia]QNA87849.1 thiol:disulfide interchange protein DsbA/DsbL [Massilia sp. Dwa41.01b]QNA98748.1 thiol:disulfide interchange protein DsbA/DsbL [Massilia sp. Se16.2.3]